MNDTDLPRPPSATPVERVEWDLTDLFETEAALLSSLENVGAEVEAFSADYRSRLHEIDASDFAAALERYQKLQDRLERAFTYAYLNWCASTEDAARGALLQTVREKYMLLEQGLLFFELEFLKLDAERADELQNSRPVGPFRHYLEVLRLRKSHVRSEAEEKILAEKSVTGREAWGRFFDEVIGALRFKFDEDVLTEQEVLAKLYDPERAVRRRAAEVFTEGLQSRLRDLTFIFNTILADKASQDRIRGYDHWLSSRNLDNEISDESVQALIAAVTSRYDLVARYYKLKQKLLGLDQLYDYDRYAPVEGSVHRVDWDEARQLVLQGYGSFHPRMAEIAERFFNERWIDAAVRPGKRGGAFSHRAVPDVHPYILMNFTGTMRDVQTLAHELGHGVHQYLARSQGSLQASPPLTTSETASVFGEMVVFQLLVQKEADQKGRLGMLISRIDDTLATVFRQVSMNQFEEQIHTARRSEGELSSDRFSELWSTTQTAMFQGSVTLGDHYRIWWSYIPHFLHTPGYVYAYAFGELLVLALYSLYRQAGDGFADDYVALLERGGSDWPHRLVARLGVDLQDPSFWRQGLGEIENLIGQAENLAGEL